MDFLSSIGSFIMTPLYYLISVLLVAWHKVFGSIFGATSGIAWMLSIVGLTLVVRLVLVPLFVKQIKSSRNMQLLQPKVKELQKKYGHDRERLGQETMKLYRDTGVNPLASCLPLLLQMPIFLALFRLLDQAAKKGKAHGVLTEDLARNLADATLFGGKISSTFINDGGSLAVKILAGVLVLAMTATTFMTQHQLMSKNMPADAMSGQYAQQQKMLLYVMPVAFGFGGIFFPLGVLFYWTTSNLWTMGQQFYVIRANPAPNTEAYFAKERRDAEKAAAKGKPEATEATEANVEDGAGTTAVTEKPRPIQRQQPSKKSRQARKKGQRPNSGPGPRAPKQNEPTSDDEGDARYKGARSRGCRARGVRRRCVHRRLCSQTSTP